MIASFLLLIALSSSKEDAPSSDKRGYTPRTKEKYDIIIIGGGFSGLYSAMRLGESSGGKLNIAIVEKNIHDENWQDGGYSRNGIKELYPNEDYQHACIGGELQDYPFKCNIDKVNNPYCPSNGDFPGVVWFGDHAMRYKTSQGSFFLAQELGFQDIHHDPNYMYGEAKGSMGHDRGYYFMGGQQLLDGKYQDDVKYGNLNTNKWEDILFAGFEEKNLENLCNEDENMWHHIRSYYANITGSSSGVELLEGSIRFKSIFGADVDAQGMMEWLDTDFKSDEGWAVYPQQGGGGMSEFVRRIYKRIIENNYADIYCDWKVDAIESNKQLIDEAQIGKYKVLKQCKRNDDMYKTNKHDRLYGDKVIVTVPIKAMHEMNGLMSYITDSVYANIWNPIDVITCSQQFETKWWENLVPKQYPLQFDVDIDDIEVDTWYSKENCMQQIEAFNSPYLLSANVIRSLYVDESKCYNFWKSLVVGSDYDIEGVIANEIRARHAEYFGVKYQDIPPALHTRCELSDQAWYQLGAGASYKIGNNPHQKVEEWAHKPLDNHNIFMCGETWSVRHGWIDGCRSHCDIMMNKYFNVDPNDLPQWRFSLHERGQCSSVCMATGSMDKECLYFPPNAILKQHET